MKERIVVLGKNYSTSYGIVRALGEAGYQPDLFFICRKTGEANVIAGSRYLNSCVEHLGRKDDEIVSEIISRYDCENEKVLLFPTDDYTASLTDRYRESFPECFIHAGISKKAAGISALMDKSFQMELAASFGFLTAASRILEYDGEKYKIPEGIVYPCYIKPLVSYEGGKRGMVICNSEESLCQELTVLLEETIKGYRILAQEYLNIDEEYSISGICIGEKVLMPAALKKIYTSKAHPGTTVFGKVEDLEGLEHLKEQLIALLGTLDYYGMVDIEVFNCGGKLYFNEINFRSSAVCYAAAAAGVNLPAMCAEYFLHGSDELSDAETEHDKTFVCEKAAAEDYLKGYLSRKEYVRMLKEADYNILFNPKDPDVQKRFQERIKKAAMKHLVQKLTPGGKIGSRR